MKVGEWCDASMHDDIAWETVRWPRYLRQIMAEMIF